MLSDNRNIFCYIINYHNNDDDNQTVITINLFNNKGILSFT